LPIVFDVKEAVVVLVVQLVPLLLVAELLHEHGPLPRVPLQKDTDLPDDEQLRLFQTASVSVQGFVLPVQVVSTRGLGYSQQHELGKWGEVGGLVQERPKKVK
jgi:hypothetical protein